MRRQFLQVRLTVLLCLWTQSLGWSYPAVSGQGNRPKNEDGKPALPMPAAGTLVASGPVVDASTIQPGAAAGSLFLTGPDNEVLAQLVLPAGADLPPEDAALLLKPAPDALNPTQISYEIQGALPAPWTERSGILASAVPGGYAGNQTDRSQQSWSGNGGSVDLASNDWITFSGRPPAPLPPVVLVNASTEPQGAAQMRVAAIPFSSKVTAPAVSARTKPRLPASRGVALTAGEDGLRLSWDAVAGQAYELLASPEISGPFQVVQTILVPTTGSVTARIPVTAGTAFFKVRLKNP